MSLDELVAGAQALVEQGDTPAVQLAVARDNEVVCFETFGAADDDTRFCVFSATKPDRRIGGVDTDRRRTPRPQPPRRALRPRVRDERQGGRHRRAGDAAHRGLPERADGSRRGWRRGDARQALHRVGTRVGARHPFRVPRARRALGARRAHRTGERARLPRLHRDARRAAARVTARARDLQHEEQDDIAAGVPLGSAPAGSDRPDRR